MSYREIHPRYRGLEPRVDDDLTAETLMWLSLRPQKLVDWQKRKKWAWGWHGEQAIRNKEILRHITALETAWEQRTRRRVEGIEIKGEGHV